MKNKQIRAQGNSVFENHRDGFLGILLALSITVLSGGGCASPNKSTRIGAGAGAATGAAVGGLAGGWKGAGLGAVAGSVLGGSIGNYLDKQANELKQVASTKRTEQGILVNLKNNLLFATGSASLKPGAISKIIELGDILAKYGQDRIRVEGHTDDVGSVRRNEALSLRRADAVKNILMSRGVKGSQILSLGMGEQDPVAPNRTPAGRSMNRRVELHIDVPPQKTG